MLIVNGAGIVRFRAYLLFFRRLLKVGYARFFLCLFFGPGPRLLLKRIGMSETVIQKLTEFADELLPSMGLELVEVQFRREQHGWVLRVFIDSPDGVSLDHCSQVSRELGDYLDVEDLIDHPYHLEVSSPGLERKLRKSDEFVRFRGRRVKVKLKEMLNERKTFVGEIVEADGETIVLELEGGERVEFTFDMVGAAKLVI